MFLLTGLSFIITAHAAPRAPEFRAYDRLAARGEYDARALAQLKFVRVFLMPRGRAPLISVTPRRNAVLVIDPRGVARLFTFPDAERVREVAATRGHVRLDPADADSRVLRAGRGWRWLPDCAERLSAGAPTIDQFKKEVNS